VSVAEVTKRAGVRDRTEDGGERFEEVVGRLRRNACIYAVAVTAVAAVAGFFVHGETAFLVAWIYVGAAGALPALLINWMVSRHEIGSMPGGRAWSAGLTWVYLDGLGILYIAAVPDTPLRAVSLLAVLPPIVCFATAAAQLGLHHEGEPLSPRRVLGSAAAVAAVLGVLTVVFLGERLASSDAAWLVTPGALVAVTMTAGAIASASIQGRITGATRRLARLGLAVMAAGAANSWVLVAQGLSDFSLPSSPMLALQAVTMGLLLQIPLHAPRVVSPDGAGADGGSRRSVVDIVSRTWFAEDPTEDGVLPRRLRRPAIVYVAVTAPLLALVGVFVDGRSAFLIAWVYTSAVYTTPAMVVTWAASRRTQYQVRPWRLWFLAVVALYLNGAGLLFVAVLPDTGLERLAIVAVVPCVALFGLAAIAMMRARSGSRSLLIDVIETTMVTTVISFGVLLLVGEEIWQGEEAWFTIPTALVTVAVTSGLAWSLTIYARMPHENRELERLGLALSLVATVDAWAMLAQGLSGFTLPSPPLLLLQAVAMGLLFLLPLYVPRTAPQGLEQLPPHEQVRSGWALVALTLVALPVLFAQANLVRDTRPWALTMFVVILMALLLLAMVRQFLAISETRALYRQVMEAADERRRLLADVMRSVDDERHRFAAQLHEQAIGSYAAMASLTREAERTGSRRGSTLLAEVSAQLQGSFGDQAESLRRLMLAMRPLEAERGRSLAERLRSPIRAYVDNLYGDAAAPAVQVDVRDGLRLGWTTEAIVLRVVQEAIGNIRRHAEARRIDVRLDVDGDAQLRLTVADDGRGFDPSAVLHESGIATMRAFAALADAELTVESRPGAGTTVRLEVRGDAPAVDQAPPPTPRLRLVPPTDT
jgi:signal transduction histidine kinase